MKSRTIAFVRKDLIDEEDYPPSSICVTREEWEGLYFYCMQLDREDDLPFQETDHPEGFNMILLHPETHQLFWVYSIDFEFMEVNEDEPA